MFILPVCILICIVNLSFRARPLPQTVHSNALLPKNKLLITNTARKMFYFFFFLKIINYIFVILPSLVELVGLIAGCFLIAVP